MPPIFSIDVLFVDVNPLCNNCLIWLGIFVILLVCFLVSRCVSEDNKMHLINCFMAVFFTGCTWIRLQFVKASFEHSRNMIDFCDNIMYMTFAFCAIGLCMFLVYPAMRRRLPTICRDLTSDVCTSICRRLMFVISAVIWSLNFYDFAPNLNTEEEATWQFICASMYFLVMFFVSEVLDMYMTRYGVLNEFSWFLLLMSGMSIVYHWYWLEINSFGEFPWNAVTLSVGVYLFSRMLLLYQVPKTGV
ncbi:protein E11 [Elephant endotheliotropic herpesvirus 5B]|uniref:Membrane protein EE38 n=1 Tax=Elephant endotheliotropic herpesvirus 5 TaxID=768738 RepID=A0A075CXS2_9BETA|nr:membrane protein EE38 [Elephant endotheliotropic herpesvirus 5]AHC02801.1 membrane protein EE38 [Elephant endotheliotropic herpesvirus 5]UVZ35196.1 protein E11 [Elephant endotheliotropic herpesvirus 5B]